MKSRVKTLYSRTAVKAIILSTNQQGAKPQVERGDQHYASANHASQGYPIGPLHLHTPKHFQGHYKYHNVCNYIDDTDGCIGQGFVTTVPARRGVPVQGHWLTDEQASEDRLYHPAQAKGHDGICNVNVGRLKKYALYHPSNAHFCEAKSQGVEDLCRKDSLRETYGVLRMEVSKVMAGAAEYDHYTGEFC